MIEHQLGAYTDCAHGAGLAAISVPYYNYIMNFGIDKFVRFAKNVWDVNTENLSKEDAAKKGLEKLKEFIVTFSSAFFKRTRRNRGYASENCKFNRSRRWIQKNECRRHFKRAQRMLLIFTKNKTSKTCFA